MKNINNIKKMVSFRVSGFKKVRYSGWLVLHGSLIVRRFTRWSSNSQRIAKVVKPKPRPFRTKLKKNVFIAINAMIVLIIMWCKSFYKAQLDKVLSVLVLDSLPSPIVEIFKSRVQTLLKVWGSNPCYGRWKKILFFFFLSSKLCIFLCNQIFRYSNPRFSNFVDLKVYNSCPWFEFSRKVRVTGSNPGNLLNKN